MVSKRYLSSLDLSEYQMEPKSNVFADAGVVGQSEISGDGEDTNIAGAEGGLRSKKEVDRRGGEG